MTIVEIFEQNIADLAASNDDDFTLYEVESGIYVGIDRQGNTALMIKSSQKNHTPISQRSKSICVECNAPVSIKLNGVASQITAHVIHCFLSDWNERIIFLELCELFITAAKGNNQEYEILQLFATLATFFAAKIEMSDNELVGLFAELYTIYSLDSVFDIHAYWQSHSKMKFDFSLSSKVKLEIKATIKSERRHHFKHEQLISEIYSIYILSYMLRCDDEGLSLWDLLSYCKNLYTNDQRRLVQIERIIKDISRDRLLSIRFSEEHLKEHRHFYKAKDIPRFPEKTPEGVINAEYDCVLDNISFLSDDDAIYAIKAEMASNNSY